MIQISPLFPPIHQARRRRADQGKMRILMFRNHVSDEWFCKLMGLSVTRGVSVGESFGSIFRSAD